MKEWPQQDYVDYLLRKIKAMEEEIATLKARNTILQTSVDTLKEALNDRISSSY